MDPQETKYEYLKKVCKNAVAQLIFELKTSQNQQRGKFSLNHSTNVDMKYLYKYNISI